MNGHPKPERCSQCGLFLPEAADSDLCPICEAELDASVLAWIDQIVEPDADDGQSAWYAMMVAGSLNDC